MTITCRVCDDHEVERYMKLKVCDSCYAGLRYWRGRSVGDVIKRDAQLTRLRKRSEFMMGVRTNQVVTPIDSDNRRRTSTG